MKNIVTFRIELGLQLIVRSVSVNKARLIISTVTKSLQTHPNELFIFKNILDLNMQFFSNSTVFAVPNYLNNSRGNAKLKAFS